MAGIGPHAGLDASAVAGVKPNRVGFCDAYFKAPSTSAGIKFTPAAFRPDQTSAEYVAAWSTTVAFAGVRVPSGPTSFAYAYTFSTTMVRAPAACRFAILAVRLFANEPM